MRTMGGERAKHYLNDCPTHSLWFEHFARGCLSRMGQIIRQDMAVSLELMHAFLAILEQEWIAAEATLAQQSLIASIGAYALIAFCGSFRGPEVFLVDLFGLKKYFQENPTYGTNTYVIVPLMGRLKNEIGDQYHLTPLAAITKSGLHVKLWIHRLLEVHAQEKGSHGPAFGNIRGEMASACSGKMTRYYKCGSADVRRIWNQSIIPEGGNLQS